MLIAPQWLSPKCAQPAHKDVSCFSLISSENLPWILALSSIICFKGSTGQVVAGASSRSAEHIKHRGPWGWQSSPPQHFSDSQHSQMPAAAVHTSVLLRLSHPST